MSFLRPQSLFALRSRHLSVSARLKRFASWSVIGLVMCAVLAPSANGEVAYRFERMWPSLQQPWYFQSPQDLAVDLWGNVYIADTYYHRIQKFSSSGMFLNSWGGWGEEGYGTVNAPGGIATDAWGNVYVANTWGHCIEKFSAAGEYITQWGEDVVFLPCDIAVDATGTVYVVDVDSSDNSRVLRFSADGSSWSVLQNDMKQEYGVVPVHSGVAVGATGTVYVADRSNHRISRFTPEGIYIDSWGQYGFDPGQFNAPVNVSIDAAGYVYVADCNNHRIQKFASDGQFIAAWGQLGTAEGTMNHPISIATNSSGQLYAIQGGTGIIQKYTSEGVFLTQWTSVGHGPGEFSGPMGVALASTGSVYVVDTYNNRIQVFTQSGEYLFEWGIFGTGDAQFDWPVAIALDSSDNVYVSDYNNHRIQRFTASGEYLSQWSMPDTGDGLVGSPGGLEIGSTGDIYVTDFANHRIQKYSPTGEFLFQWGRLGTGDGEFSEPTDVAFDSYGNVYVADHENDRIQKFTSNGNYIAQWGTEGDELGQFSKPFFVAVDASDFVYVTDSWGQRVQKFTSDGVFVTALGKNNGHQFYNPTGIAVNESGDIFVSDGVGNRIQKFKAVNLFSNPKAIVVAGGGPFPGNNLWDATQASAHFAYRTLRSQGFQKDSVAYLSSNTQLDLDENGLADDIHADASNANLHEAITQWALEPTDGLPTSDVVVYLVDHGGDGTFRMSGTEIMNMVDLDQWLDYLQEFIQGRLIIILDSCMSGSLCSALSTPEGKERIVIASTASDQPAYFLSRGSISFSSFFWTHIFNGLDIQQAFLLANSSIQQSVEQYAQIDAGNAVANEQADLDAAMNVFIGNGTRISGSPPAITESIGPQTISETATASIWADAIDGDGVARVWAVLRPPDYVPSDPGNPVQDLPSFELAPSEDTLNRWTASYDNFSVAGTYQIALYAQDHIGNVSPPTLTEVSVQSPMHRKAIIVAGQSSLFYTWMAADKGAKAAYKALKTFQSYSDENIQYFSPIATSLGVDGTAVLANLHDALTIWAKQNTSDLTVYMIGDGSFGSFHINETETLTPTLLKSWLDDAQSAISGKITVIYDASYSGSFISGLTPPPGKSRIVITSTSRFEPAPFLFSGDLTFSQFFWQWIRNGEAVGYAFAESNKSVSRRQSSQLDDTNNGTPNEKTDGVLSRDFHLGPGIMLAGDNPIIGQACPPQELTDTSSATLYVEQVTTTSDIAKVWAVLVFPSREDECLTLEDMGNGRYETTYDEFPSSCKTTIAFYAMDTKGDISPPALTTVVKDGAVDAYEDDDTKETASWIGVDGPDQTHNFSEAGDEDWAYFYAEAGEVVTLDTLALDTDADTYLELLREDGTLIESDDDGGYEQLSSHITWTVDVTGIYFVRVTASELATVAYGPNTFYDLRVWHESGASFPGRLTITVKDASNDMPLSDARVLVTSPFVRSGMTGVDGSLLFATMPANTYFVTVSLDGYISKNAFKTVPEGDDAQLTVNLVPIINVLEVAPDTRTVNSPGGSVSFNVSNSGNGNMVWNASVTEGESWLSLSSGASGEDTGAIVAVLDANVDNDRRTGTIRIVADGATNSPRDVTVVQYGLTPSVEITSSAPAATNVSLIPIQITFSEAVNSFGPEDLAVTNGSVASFDGTGAVYTAGILRAGQGTVTVRILAGAAQDSDGLPNTESNLLERVFDSVPPDAPNVSGTTPTTDTTPIWTWSSGGNGGSGHYRYRLDDPDFAGITIDVTETSFTPSPLATGLHTLYVQERDAAGNWSESGLFTISVIESSSGGGCQSAVKIMSTNVMEEEMPLGTDALPEASVQPSTALALRLTADEPIDPDSIWGIVEANQETGVPMEYITQSDWQPIDETDGSDGWAIAIPDTEWPTGLVTATAGATTITGKEVQSVSATFRIEAASNAPKDLHFIVQESAVPELPAILAVPLTPVYRVGHYEVYDEPVTVQIPLPADVAPEACELFYYSESTRHRGWFLGENVQGWLVPGSTRTGTEHSQAYIEFEINHSGIVQVGQLSKTSLGGFGSIDVGATGSTTNWLLMAVTTLAIVASFFRILKRKA